MSDRIKLGHNKANTSTFPNPSLVSSNIPTLANPIRSFGLPTNHVAIDKSITVEESQSTDEQSLLSSDIQQRSFSHDFSRIPLHSVQAKLTLGEPKDKYEQQADWMANQVMRMIVPDKPPSVTPVQNSWQRKCAACEEEENKSVTVGDLQSGNKIEERLNRSKGEGSPLPHEVRSFMEPRFGTDFSGVRVHTGNEAVQMNRELNAQAFTHKQDVYFGAGKAPARDILTAHELTHVMQQTKQLQRSPNGSPPDISRQRCHPTSRWPGNIEHSLIESDYLTNINPSGGAVEYAIPESGRNGGTGYADMVDVVGHKVYEIKTFIGAPAGEIEAERYAAKAQEHCAPPIPQSPWTVGNDYPAHTIEMNSNEELVVQQYPQFSGVVVYYKRRRRPVTEPEPFPVPVPEPGQQTDEERRRRTNPQQQPVPIPQSAMQQIREFLRQVVQSGQNAEQAARQFLQQHPELIYFIAGFAIGIFVGTIIEDILTLGAGIADDPATLAAAAALWRIAMQLRTAQ